MKVQFSGDRDKAGGYKQVVAVALPQLKGSGDIRNHRLTGSAAAIFQTTDMPWGAID